MQCAKCHKDFKEDEKEKGFYTQQNAHFMRPFRQFGYVCPHCSFHNMMIQVPIKVLFNRSGRTYDKLDEIVAKFRAEVEEFYRERNRMKPQQSLFPNEDD